jgi:hypothetical protein
MPRKTSLRRRSSDTSRRKYSDAERGGRSSGPNLMDLKTLYEGPSGKRASKMLYKTTLVITNQTVEIEREGANACASLLTCGCWYFCFQTTSVEIYELQRLQTLYLKDGVIVGEIQPRDKCGHGKFEIDCCENGDKTTKELFSELKEAWSIARHSVLQNDDDPEPQAAMLVQ